MLRPAQCVWRHLNAQRSPSCVGSKMTVEVSFPSVECSLAHGQMTACLRIGQFAKVEALRLEKFHHIGGVAAVARFFRRGFGFNKFGFSNQEQEILPRVARLEPVRDITFISEAGWTQNDDRESG